MIPLEDFFRKPERALLRLSPSGCHLSFVAPWKRRLNVFVRDVETGEETRITSATERDIAGYTWVSDDRIVYAQDQGGDENHRLYAVDRTGEDRRDLTPYDGVKCSIVDDLEEQDDTILFQMNKRDPQVFDVFRLDTRSGDMELIAENPGNISQWITDHDGRLRIAVTTDGVNSSLLYRETEAADWRPVATYNFKEGAHPLYFAFGRESIYVTSNVGRDKAAIFEYDPATGEHGALIYEHEDVDVSGLLCSKRRKKITGVAFETDRPGYHFFDETRADIQRFLDERLPGRINRLASHSRDESMFIVHSGSDKTRGGYHLLDAAKMELTPLFELSPWLPEEQMATMQPIVYQSRDGLTIHGYLTLPNDKGDAPSPMVVHPHGGPWARDSFGFNPEIQFLASRGYAVLQMNFRGSTGYGREFMEASFGQWGLAMQDDVTDGVQWAIDQGYADPKRIAIYGGSYGGYATLAGLTKTPELYACGIDYVGVSNLFTFMESIPPYWKPYLEMMHEMVGHPEQDEERFRATSPCFHADKITAPLFVAQGANDPRVVKAESDQIVAALRERGVDVDYLVKDNEGHGFSNEENQFEFYRAMEAFLARHVGGGAS